jgi:excisionase family DNA binding protein
MNEGKFITPLEASTLLQVSQQTLINWDKEGKIKAIRTKGRHRRYLLSSILSATSNTLRRKICYCRVSTSSQKEDLERQVVFFRSKFPNHEIIKDIGSGLNFKRKGFNAILESSIKGDIEEIVVSHKDRLCRFGFEMFQRIIESSNGKILVLDQQETSPNQELVSDILSIITVFSSRIYGLRSHSICKKIKEASKEKENSNETNNKSNEKEGRNIIQNIEDEIISY